LVKEKGGHCVGDWSFAGGHLEFKESVEECAKRELEEETSLKALSIKYGPWIENVMENDKHYVTLFVFVDDFLGEPKLLEPHKCEGWEWFAWNKLPLPLFAPIHSLIAKMGLENLQHIQLAMDL
jgi:8-oxo-dGTP diphosphatase